VRSNRNQEFGAQHSVAELEAGLHSTDRIRARDNGNRTANPRAFLAKVERILPRIGVTRVADISFLAEGNYPVFQTCRPSIFFHTAIGQNTGSQGKGPNIRQAKLSAMMEAVESYCAEPRAPSLIRASYDFLQHHQTVADPRKFAQQTEAEPLRCDAALMWTNAFCFETKRATLVPAELAYFPFFPHDYQTPCLYPCSTNGLASGASYLEAVIHGFYEVIERHYCYLFEAGAVEVEAIYEQEVSSAAVQRAMRNLHGDFELQLYAMRVPTVRRNLPFIMCLLVGDDAIHSGYGCSGNVEMSIERAVSEAFQSRATEISGTREDMDGVAHVPFRYFDKTAQPQRRTLRIERLRRTCIDRRFATLADELRMIQRYLKQLGIERSYAVNLTRNGVDLPVVKVICEQTRAPVSHSTGAHFMQGEITAYTFPTIAGSPA
jgi:ribosomal protein S12 methylthiotransferase accessory factor